MHIESIDGSESLTALEETWRAIENRNPSLSVFQSWNWNSLWQRTVLPRIAGASARHYVAFDGAGKPVAIVPLFGRSLFGGCVRLFQLAGHRMSFLNDIICADPHDPDQAQAILAHLRRTLGAREFVHLRHMHGSSVFTGILLKQRLAEIQCRRLLVKRNRAGVDVLDGLSSNKRKDLRWKENKLRKRTGASFAAVPPDDVTDGFERFLTLHRARFASRRRATVLDDANVDFLRAAFLSLHRAGKAELLEIRSPDATIATMLGIIDNGRYYFVNSGFDETYAQYSPVKLLLTMAMRRAFNELGCEQFELGPDYESYKLDWRPEYENGYTACISGANPYSKLAAAGYRLAFRRTIKRVRPLD